MSTFKEISKGIIGESADSIVEANYKNIKKSVSQQFRIFKGTRDYDDDNYFVKLTLHTDNDIMSFEVKISADSQPDSVIIDVEAYKNGKVNSVYRENKSSSDPVKIWEAVVDHVQYLLFMGMMV